VKEFLSEGKIKYAKKGSQNKIPSFPQMKKGGSSLTPTKKPQGEKKFILPATKKKGPRKREKGGVEKSA